MILLLTLACACPEPDAPVPGPASCPYETWAWDATPAATVQHHVVDGVISMDPPGAPATSRDGSWDGEAVTWTDLFAPDYSLASRDYTGVLTLNPDGDWSATGRLLSTDVLGRQRGYDIVETQRGCTLDRTLSPLQDDGYGVRHETVQTVSDDLEQVSIQTEFYGHPYLRHELHTRDLERSWVLDYDDGSYVAHGVNHGDGTGEYAYTLLSASRYEGHYWLLFDGSKQLDFSSYDLDTDALLSWGSMLYAYDGSGQGSYAFTDEQGAWVSCDWVTDGQGTCTLSCDDGEIIDCS